MEKRVDLERLRTMEDVLRERIRVRYDIRQRKHNLKGDFERVGEVFSVDYWKSLLEVKIASAVQNVTAKVASRIRGFASGFSMLQNLMGNLGSRFCRPPRPEPDIYMEEEEFYYGPDAGEEIFEENPPC